MGHHVASTDHALIGGLKYKLQPGASYVINRRSVSYFASGGNSYSPNGVKAMQFNITGDQWLDPNTFRVMFQIDNHNGNNSAGFCSASVMESCSCLPKGSFHFWRTGC